jgi:hypothetical protein
MNKREIILANIMLAKFMGVKVDDQGMNGYDWDDLEYHESWEWLMPVVEKIWRLTLCRSSLFYFEHRGATIFGDVNRKLGSNEVDNMGDCYSAVVKFVEYYKTLN